MLRWTGTGSAWTRELLREVARLIAVAPRSSGVLIETVGGHSHLDFLVVDGELLDCFLPILNHFPGLVEWVERPTPPEPTDLRPEGMGVLVHSSISEAGPERWAYGDLRSARLESPVASARAARFGVASIDGNDGFAPQLPPSTWWAAQLHLLSEGNGRIFAHTRFRLSSTTPLVFTEGVFALAVGQYLLATGPLPVRVRWRRPSLGRRREWRRGALSRTPRDERFSFPPDSIPQIVLIPKPPTATDPTQRAHCVVFGASGAGKSTYLGEMGSRQIHAGGSVVAFDLHGDLGPRLVSRIRPEHRDRVVAIDAHGSVDSLVGLPILGQAPPEHRERESALLVAALRRLSSDGSELYWGFRLERIFDTFVRLVQEEGGTLHDLHELLTDARRRSAARLATRSVPVARFLDELAPLLARNPEFLWPAAARVAKVALIPAVSALLSPNGPGLPVRDLLSKGRSIVWRLPFGVLGPETSAFVASLLAGRVYLDRLSEGVPTTSRPTILFLLDEAQAFAPMLLTEILSEGRKFGVQALIATQYPERLPSGLRAAAQGAVGTHLCFRIPAAGAASAGAWFGLSRSEAERVLPQLPVGTALKAGGERLTLERVPAHTEDSGSAWAQAVSHAGNAFRSDRSWIRSGEDLDPATESILLGIFALAEQGRPTTEDAVLRAVESDVVSSVDLEGVLGLLPTLARRGWLDRNHDAWFLTPAGLARLGYTANTGATKETVAHRALILDAFRIFARRGYRLEILRQGRFDYRVPDARFRQVPDRIRFQPPDRLAAALERVRTGWAWKFFHGKDVHVEAEVSGATRAERIHHGLTKAREAHAFALFVVGDAHRAHTVRRILRTEGKSIGEAQVWTLCQSRSSHEPESAL